MASISRRFVLDVPLDAVFEFARRMNRHPSEKTKKEVESRAPEAVAFDYGCCREDIKLTMEGEKTAVEITITSENQENPSKGNMDFHASYLAWLDSVFDLRHGDEPRRVCVGCRVRLDFEAVRCAKCGKEYAPLVGALRKPA